MSDTKLSRKEQRAASDARIIDSAVKCFGENGYTHSTMVAIAKGAGVTGGLLVQRYESKENLLIEAYKMVMFGRFTDETKYYSFPECLYRIINELKVFKKRYPLSFQFLKMVLNSTDLPEGFLEMRRAWICRRQTYRAIVDAQREGIISKGDVYSLFQIFMFQVVNQIDISDRFDISYPEDEYFFRVFQVTDDVITESESKRKALVESYCMTFDALAYIYVKENRIDEIAADTEFRIELDKSDARGTYDRLINNHVQESDREDMRVFLNLDTIDVRMEKKRHASREYTGVDGRRIVISFAVVNRDRDGSILEMVAGVRSVE